MKTNQLRLFLSALSLAALSACGGGDSSTPSKPDVPVATTCSNGATDFPTCTFFAANLQTTVPTPAISADSAEYKGWVYLNDLRSTLGLGKLAYSVELAKAAKAHADYLSLNKVLTHVEEEGKLGFTGKNAYDRAVAAGYARAGDVSASEGIAYSNNVTMAVKELLNSVYHRSTLLQQDWRDIGFGTTCYDCRPDDGVSLVSNPAFKLSQGPQRNASDYLMVYPLSGQTDVPLSMCGEKPWPFPESEVTSASSCTNPRYTNGILMFDMTVGSPIMLAVEAKINLTVSSFVTWEDGGAPIAAWINANANDKLVLPNEVYLTAKGGLKPNTKYWAKFQGSANGKVIVKEWSFTTARGFN
jgi:uncharacterized protein YkwD